MHSATHHEPRTDHLRHGAGEEGGLHAHHSPTMFRDRFWLALVLTLPILYFSEPVQGWFGYRALSFPGAAWVNPTLGTVIYLYGGLVFLRGARHELAGGRPGMMTLISLAISVAYLYSMAVAFGLPGMPFFWELATLLVIMLLGHWLELTAVQNASRALDDLASLLPRTAHRLAGGAVQDVPVSELRRGDDILVRPGEQVPADGRVTEGRSSLDEAFLTGESRPVPKAEGAEVVAGSVNGEGALTVSVTRTGGDTTLSQVQRLVQEARTARSRYQGLADRAAGWLFYVAVGAGLVTFVAWLAASGDLEQAIGRTVTVLVIACPHALGLAIPLVTVNATAVSAANAILVRNREAFERAHDVRIVAFDKTGTLTEAAFEVGGVVAVAGLPEPRALAIMAALETRSEHPLARAIAAAAAARGLALPAVDDFEVAPGRGVTGSVEGVRYSVGSPDWLGERELVTAPALENAIERAEASGESAICLAGPDRVLAVVSLADRIRDGARAAIAALTAAGIEPVMITGDAEAVASSVARELGIARYHARVLPADKAARVRELKATGRTAFVGDGINDAPALLAADLGVAIGAGTDVAIESADLVLVADDPRSVVTALRLSRATYRKMVQNLGWAVGYNAVAIPLAAGALASLGVLLSPAAGAVLMSVSTIVVAVNAMTLRWLRPTA